ncbi:MAG: tyrosine-type recombinase/integrase [Pseudomonadota bacterium]
MVSKTIKNKASIEAIKPDNVRREYPDQQVPPLYLVVQPSGKMSWAIRFRHPKSRKPQKFTIGGYPRIGLADARSLARDQLSLVEKGIDIVAERKKERQVANDETQKIGYQVDAFFKRYVEVKRAPSTIKETRRLFNVEILPKWRNRKVAEIERRDVVQLLDGIMDRNPPAPYVANRVHSALSRFSNWLVERSVIEKSFCEGVKKQGIEVVRERVLSDDECVIFWRATDDIGFPFGEVAKLLLLTGQRRSEIANLKWSEVDFERKELKISSERMKGKETHLVPLSPQAMDILRRVPRVSDGPDGFVFTTTGVTAASGYSKAKTRLDIAMAKLVDGEAIKAWRYHDLRRTAASGMAGLKIPPHVVEAVLAHKSGVISGVASVYNHYQYYEEKREALEEWGRQIDLLINPPEDNVIQLNGT